MKENTGTYNVINTLDLKSDTAVKWCAGCGAHAILSTVRNAISETNINKEDIVFVSGIGCSSRFPYYINTYGFHGLHGRAAAIASGIKMSNPGLSVWVVTGDGDSMAIGGNHFIHVIRRNIDLSILLFNNQIYALTKGQYSPTTPKGSITKTSPDGTIENPFKPGELVMGAQGTFFARVIDTDPRMMKEVFIEADKHKGTAVVEILQNCVIFNDDVHRKITGKDVRLDNQIYLKHGEPMIFGKNRDKGLIMKNNHFEVVILGQDGITEKDVLVHNAHDKESGIHYNLVRMSLPDLPVAMGIIRDVENNVYETLLFDKIRNAKAKSNIKNVDDLLKSGNVFNINGSQSS